MNQNTLAAWPAPAKINLFLHITGRRADGYHDLETVFQFLDLADGITFRVRHDGEIRRMLDPAGDSIVDLAAVPPERDLTVRTARALQGVTGTPLGVDIGITKRLPLGGGLGGGSSDAATTLVGLNRVWGLGLGVEELAAIGLTLGADVPVFVWGQAAFATGVGEKLTRVTLEEPWYLIVYPGCSVTTAEIFNAPDLTRDTSPIKIHTLSQEWINRERGDERQACRAGHDRVDQTPLLSPFRLQMRTRNDCEAVVRERYPPVNATLDWLSRFGSARMTGTGACVFASFGERQEAEHVLGMLPNREKRKEGKSARWWGFVAHGRNRSPLNDFSMGFHSANSTPECSS
uniref:4-diphosphocytidyl-2-C-methyl-D-erythritol kinase n=1 Tax=Candidatus Kentrum eta TaxID=2126337 RepID=A0A450UL58_9GAMM|nr:MAG: 4-diphosphocytidyl-2-C-methyl-D-erythritol kinase [Candidatus Kentron sp. H]VFJ94158.1 MAG: 4-diphosphocytidyl-2-C-methyl-D-erythritol kinase [Candidatus Kentron sp. H]VFK00778.1 MAG: 4-diphosphocytidyl-2-C-methyl-D-erythritol kinase [Candidatus Kentron sp. H]